jgi:oxygen-dependent protoporphyrinogen oxidase
MAQYEIGHLERLQRMRHFASLPGFVLAGNAFTGIGVPDCVRSGTQAADRLSSVFGLRSADAAQPTGIPILASFCVATTPPASSQ